MLTEAPLHSLTFVTEKTFEIMICSCGIIGATRLTNWLDKHFTIINNSALSSIRGKWPIFLWRTESFIHFTLYKDGYIYHLHPSCQFQRISFQAYRADPAFEGHQLHVVLLPKDAPHSPSRDRLRDGNVKWTNEVNCLAFCLKSLDVSHDPALINLDLWNGVFNPEIFGAIVLGLATIEFLGAIHGSSSNMVFCNQPVSL
ncbi:hypothetical protein PROFUN_11103 [Planoprotostelium fungivorum]|uniref:Uncharacterized protein n=1 Tax=Planoprotostelium fungivorum TaxID=1890364 RepID=A0A2P6NAM5_9EUKA|nr:hypothetical protein PROFUN_11103 [Planoprotostelium fungivorum]